jgi:hypothetical protein
MLELAVSTEIMLIFAGEYPLSVREQIANFTLNPAAYRGKPMLGPL